MGFALAIDGPSGAGKSSVAKEISKRLKYIYVDTGAMYRTVALYVLNKGINVSDTDNIIKVLSDIDIKLKFIDGGQRIFLSGDDVTDKIRAQDVAEGSSIVATIKEVREFLVKMQREIAKGQDVIMDGRDIGTVVLPDAELKIYLSASVESRAKRRINELMEKGQNPNYETVKKEIEIRDDRDMNRKIDPLIKAEDSYFLDSSNMSFNEVVEEIIGRIP